MTGARNPLGLRLTYDDRSGRVRATLSQPLEAGAKLFIRLRRGSLSESTEKALQCGELTEATPVDSALERAPSGVVVYDGPAVEPALLKDFYTAEWGQGAPPTPEMLEALKLGPDSIVEACVVRGTQVRAKMQVGLPLAWDEARSYLTAGAAHANGIRLHAEDAGIVATGEEEIHSMEKYAELCVKELGDIPFFPKNADGTYATYNCRTQGVPVPVTVTDATGAVTEPDSDPDKCDKPQYLRENCEPGVTVQSGVNAAGSRWVLLCRAVEDDGTGKKKTTTFNDMAMIGHNPATGKTCFFQNKLYDGKDGAHVPHPADPIKSKNLWDTPKGYCNSCHSADPFVHSPWIDGALKNGKPVVPKMGVDPAMELGNPDAPYSIVNLKGQGWTMQRQLVSDEAAACTSCHRMGEGNMMSSFAQWSVGQGEGYYSRVTDPYKAFASSHWMPPKLGTVTEATWADSKFGKAAKFIKDCTEGTGDCKYAPIPTAPAPQ